MAFSKCFSFKEFEFGLMRASGKISAMCYHQNSKDLKNGHEPNIVQAWRLSSTGIVSSISLNDYFTITSKEMVETSFENKLFFMFKMA